MFLRADGVNLRDFTAADVDDALAIVGDDRVTRWLSFDSRDRAGAERMIVAATASAGVDPRTEYYLAIAEPATDQVVGFVRIATGGHRAAKLGFAVHADCWGRGHATDAARGMIAFGFKALGLHRITAAIGPDNHASQAVVERLGFSLEGCLRDHVFTNGSWRDSLLYSLLRPESDLG